MKALAKAPLERVPSAEAFVEGVKDYLSGATKRRESEQLTTEAAAELEALLAEGARPQRGEPLYPSRSGRG
jgi:hypothetical protein